MEYRQIVTLFASVCLSGIASGAAWLRLPTVENRPVNLASAVFVGTQVQSSSGLTNASALLAGSSAGVVSIPAGASEAVISLGQQQLVDHVSFINDGAAGKLGVAASADQKEWMPVAEVSFTALDRDVSVNFAAAHAKYIRLTFAATTGSSISKVRISGPAGMQSCQEVRVEGTKTREANLASAAFGAQLIYVHPTPENSREVDAGRVFKFPKTAQRHRTLVYDLGSARSITTFHAAYSRVPTKVQVYTFDDLPEKKDWRGKLALDPAAFDGRRPVAVAEDARGAGIVQIGLDHPVEAQHVVFRFEANYEKARPAGLNSESTDKAGDAAAEAGDNYVIYDAAACGDLPFVFVSTSSISLVRQKLGPAATEESALHTILAAAGLGAIADDRLQSQAGHPSISSPTAGMTRLNPLGSSAYRGSGSQEAGRSPFGASLDTRSPGT